MKRLLWAATLAAATFLTSPAHAGILSVTAFDDGVAVLLACAGGVNAPISCGGSSTNFVDINIAAVGAPPLPLADLSSLTIDATSANGGTHTLDLTVTQTGLAIATSGVATSTFTVNNLVDGPFGPTTESTFINGALFASATFDATTINDTTLFTGPAPALITSDAHAYSITFTGAEQTATDTIQLVVSTPEPGALGLLGVGLLGLGLVRYKSTGRH
jgi:hypothetical protein